MRTKLVITYLLKAKMIDIPRDSLIDYADVLRYPQKELVFLFLGHGEELFENIQRLCHRKNEDKRIFLTPDDTFFLCAPPSDNIEDLFTKTVDELFKTQAKIVYLKRKEVAPMHAREEDLKFILSYLKPKYYLPIRGSYSQMLANAKLAVSMGIGLNHMNVFILENGLVLNFDEAGHPNIRQDKNIDTTELIIDGFGISNTNRGQIEARNAMSVGGIVVIASTISLSKRKMITKPDCQMRGFVFVKDAEPILKEITSIYIEEVEKELKENSSGFDNEKVTNTITDRANKTIQRHLKRNPLLLPLIFEVE